MSFFQCKRVRSATTSLLHYVRSYMRESERVFHLKRKGNTTCVSYGGLQAAYIKNCGLVVESYQMVEGDHSFFFPWDDLLREYAKKKWLIETRRLFNIMPNRSTVSWHVMIQGYIKIGNMEEARKIFESSPKAGTSWESMICGYARHGMSNLAIEMLNRGLKNSFFTFQMLIAGYFIADDWEAGANRTRATYVPLDNNTATWNLLIEGNIFIGLKDGAHPVFKLMENYNVHRNVMSWNSMIGILKRYPSNVGEIRELFLKMPETLRNSHSWNLLMSWPVNYYILSEELRVEKVVSAFLHMPEKHQSVASWNTLIYVYLQNGMLHQARLCFDTMPQKNPHSWGLMIAGYLEKEMVDEAKKIFVDKRIRVDEDLHSFILILSWFVRNKMMDDARQFIIENVPKRPLSFYSIARACVKHGLVKEYKLVWETMQSIMGTNLDIHQTITFMEEKLKEKRTPRSSVYFDQIQMESTIAELEADGDFSNPTYLKLAQRVKEQSTLMFKYETHSHSGVFMQILDSQILANGDVSKTFLKGAWDCCGVVANGGGGGE